MMATGGKANGYTSFNTDLAFALYMGTDLINWDCLLLNLVTVTLKFAGKWPKHWEKRLLSRLLDPDWVIHCTLHPGDLGSTQL